MSPSLTYHGIHHTLDVLEQVERLAAEEGVDKKEDLLLLKIAALYHDSGFLTAYKGHEEVGCELAKKELPGFGVNEKNIEKICGMIMATKIPQSPHNEFEKIICDADLDYLGRNDFFTIAHSLFQELKALGMVKDENEWNHIQVNFIGKHKYFTPSSIRDREKSKQKHLKEVERLIEPE
ncbi:MAG TPA: HD domain-containing protein [Chitinophagaceae bacterium]|nr:HD domain-containing protein [Chitinophagaceae bacterium]